jgi:hypothetical protein
MKALVGYIFVLAAFVLFPAQGIAQESKRSLSDLAWLSGCWDLNVPDKNLLVSEQWMKPLGGMMVGAARTVKGGKAVGFEYLRIVEDAEGIFYVAKPAANKEETRFRLIRSSPGEVVFENPTHDFPQRVMYKLSGDKLDARIEGTMNGKLRGIDFPHVRVKCE